MKKIILILSMALMVLLGNVTSVLADAITYDVKDAGYYVYVATPDGGLNMRYGPGTEYGKVTENRIPDGVRLYIGSVSGNWGYTSYNGNEGWVALRQTTKTPPAPPSTPKPTQVSTPTPAPATPMPQSTQQTATPSPQNTDQAPQVTEEATPDAEAEQLNSEDVIIVEKAMLKQILLIAILLLLVVVMAIVAVIVINSKSKK